MLDRPTTAGGSGRTVATTARAKLLKSNNIRFVLKSHFFQSGTTKSYFADSVISVLTDKGTVISVLTDKGAVISVLTDKRAPLSLFYIHGLLSATLLWEGPTKLNMSSICHPFLSWLCTSELSAGLCSDSKKSAMYCNRAFVGQLAHLALKWRRST